MFPKLFAFCCYILFFHASAWAYFPDTEESFYRHDIDALRSQNVIKGYADGIFLPKQTVNRAEMLKMILYARDGHVPNIDESCFQDVNKGQWYTPYVCQGKKEGVVEGYENGYFLPEKAVNWAEALKMIFTSFHVNVPDEQVWYEGYVQYAHKNNILSFFSYLPDQEVTRERMAQLIYRTQSFFRNKKLDWNSYGCGKNLIQKTSISAEVSQQTRNALLYIPESANNTTPKKLLFAFHGRTNSNEQVRGYYRFEKYNPNDYIIIYPSGLRRSDQTFSWSNPGDKKTELRDYQLFDKLLVNLLDNYCVDTRHIYIAGHSLGAWFTNSLTCNRGDIVRGSGSLGGSSVNTKCAGPVASMVLHNPKDRLSPIQSGYFALDIHKKQNSCKNDQSVSTQPQDQYHCQKYTSCYKDIPVVWCPHTYDYGWKNQYYPHNWPSETGKHILNFFESLKE
jgi:polyhydroxybutyrate depolymerase